MIYNLVNLINPGFRVDAAKHMWPADIVALQDKLDDTLDGGRPYFYMEVIDYASNGEITVNEYFHTGQVTEFRYCSKVAEGAKGFWGFQGVYDPVNHNLMHFFSLQTNPIIFHAGLGNE